MNLKNRYLRTMVSIGVGTLIAGNSFADAPSGVNRADIFGDRLINLPLDESTVNNRSVDVWYLNIDGAHSYTWDLVGSGAAAQSSGCAGPGADQVLTMSGIIPADPSACGAESTHTMPGDSSAPALGFFPPSLHLCKYTLPDLPDGNYALAINPLMIGSNQNGNRAQSFQEARQANNCRPQDDDGNVLNPQLPVGPRPYTANTLRDNVLPGQREHDNNYQLFTVADASPAPTMAPSAPLPISPNIGGIPVPFIPLFTFVDSSGDAGRASWYQLWITDPSGNKITDFNHNPVGAGWFNVAVDTGEINCTLSIATGDRTCVVNAASSPTLAALMISPHSPNVKYKWWVRGWNAVGGLPAGSNGAWSPMGKFVGSP